MPPAERDYPAPGRRTSCSPASYVVVFGTIGTFHAWRVLHPVVVMLRPGDEPTEDDQRDVLAAPRRIFLFQALLGRSASVLFFVQFTRYSWRPRPSRSSSSWRWPAGRRAASPTCSPSGHCGRWLARCCKGLPRAAVRAQRRQPLDVRLGPGHGLHRAGHRLRRGRRADRPRAPSTRQQLALTTIVLGGITLAGRRLVVVRRRAGEQRADPQPARGATRRSRRATSTSRCRSTTAPRSACCRPASTRCCTG